MIDPTKLLIFFLIILILAFAGGYLSAAIARGKDRSDRYQAPIVYRKERQ